VSRLRTAPVSRRDLSPRHAGAPGLKAASRVSYAPSGALEGQAARRDATRRGSEAASGASRRVGAAGEPEGRAGDRLGNNANTVSLAGQPGCGEELARLKEENRAQAARQRAIDRLRLLEVLWRVSRVKRISECRRKPIADHVGLRVVERAGGNSASLSGVSTCSSVWGCPCCSASIRAERASDLERLAVAWIGSGRECLFVTTTIRHWLGLALAVVLPGLLKSWTFVQAGKWWKGFCGRHGILGAVKAVEITRGGNGWHPHLHMLFFIERRLGTPDLEISAGDEARQIEEELFVKWHNACLKKLPAGVRPDREHGIRVEIVRSAKDVARYVAKIQDEAGRERSMGNEMLRGDLKAGRCKESRTPLEILADYARTKSAADLALWHEVEAATHRLKCLTWSTGLRAKLEVILAGPAEEERTDEEIAADDEVAGEEPVGEVLADGVVLIEKTAWKQYIVRVEGRLSRLYEVALTGGCAGVVDLLRFWLVPASAFTVCQPDVVAPAPAVSEGMTIADYVRQARRGA
jgi:hypothetical protein